MFRRLAQGTLSASLAAILLALPLAASAQAWPSKPLKLIVPFPPGGPTDIVGRLVAQKLSDALGQQVVVENRAGAGGTVGSDAAAKSAADGYTLLYGSTSTLAIAPALYRNLPYEPLKAFAPISLVSSAPLLVTVAAKVPATTLAEFIRVAKERPGQMNYASAGNGTPPHLAAEMFKQVAGVDLVHVPYKGGGPAMQAVMAGEVDAIFEGQVTLAPGIRAGKMRALAISGPQRDAALPDVPTSAEAGLPAFQVTFWSGLVAPAGTPADVVRTLNAATVKLLQLPDVREGLARQGLAPAGNTPEAFRAFIADEMAKWDRAVKTSGAKVD
jgi:tripartite-type tricarboxylate transporter receptor subunit TctC